MPAPYSVALLGFSPFERNTLASYFRLATHRSPCYSLVQTLNAPDFMVADADHGPSVQLALAEDMLARTVFIGSQAPAGATAWMQRPIDPLHVMRELDAMVPLLSASLGTSEAAPKPAPAPNPLATPGTDPSRSAADPHGNDLPTLILAPFGKSAAGKAAAPATASATPDLPLEPPVHGQRTVTLPRRFRRGTIEQAFENNTNSAPKVPATAQPVLGAASDRADELADGRTDGLANSPAQGWNPAADSTLHPAGRRTTPAPTAPAAATPSAAPAATVDLDPTAPAQRTLALPTPVAAQPTGLPPPRALLVDDSELARHFLARLLEPWGVVCDQARGSQQALHCLSERDYDYIFLDLELGADSDLDGLSLCQHIKRLHSSSVQMALATVVMVSAHHSESDRVRGSLAGCDAYLGKPLKLDELQGLLLRQGLKSPAGAAARPPASRPG